MTVSNGKLLLSALKNLKSSSLNREFIGYSIEKDLEPAKIADTIAYAEATRDLNPLYEAEKGIVPPFFIAKLVMPYLKEILIQPDLHLNLLRMVHGQQEVSWLRPVIVGDKLKLSMKIKDITDTQAGELMTVAGKLYANNKLAAEAYSGFLIRGQKKKTDDKKKEEPVLKEAFRIALQTDDDQALEYARASGDNLFIHTSNILAKLAGLPRTIMHGLCVLAMTCSGLAGELVKGDIRKLTGISARFSHPVLPGQKIEIVGYKSKKKKEVPFNVFNSSGKTVLKNGIIRYK